MKATLTSTGRTLFGGGYGPAENPVRFRACTVCGKTIDILREDGIWWDPKPNTFRHTAHGDLWDKE